MKDATARLADKIELGVRDRAGVTVEIGRDRLTVGRRGSSAMAGTPLSLDLVENAPIEISIDGSRRVRIRCSGEADIEIGAGKMTFAAEDILFDAENITLRAADRVQLLGKEVDANHHLKVLGGPRESVRQRSRRGE